MMYGEVKKMEPKGNRVLIGRESYVIDAKPDDLSLTRLKLG